MKEYRSRPYVKAKYHEYYVVNKARWGEIKKSKQNDNDKLHAINTEKFIDDAQR